MKLVLVRSGAALGPLRGVGCCATLHLVGPKILKNAQQVVWVSLRPLVRKQPSLLMLVLVLVQGGAALGVASLCTLWARKFKKTANR